MIGMYMCMDNDVCDRVTWLYPCVAIDLIEVHTVAVIFCSCPSSNNHHGVFEQSCRMEEMRQGLLDEKNTN